MCVTWQGTANGSSLWFMCMCQRLEPVLPDRLLVPMFKCGTLAAAHLRSTNMMYWELVAKEQQSDHPLLHVVNNADMRYLSP